MYTLKNPQASLSDLEVVQVVYANEQAHRFAPHFGRTLKSLNDALRDRISDHSPIMVDLPLGEPRLDKR